MSDRENGLDWDDGDSSEAALDAMLASTRNGLLKAIRHSLDLDDGLAWIIGQPPLRETFPPFSVSGSLPTSRQPPSVNRAGVYQPYPGERVMARGLPTKPHKAIRYTLVAWFIDSTAGRRDGGAAIPDLPVGSAGVINPRAGTTPYLDIRRRHFLDRCERERSRLLNDLEPVHRQLATLRQDIAAAEKKVLMIRQRLDDMPSVPAEEALGRRNAVEQHVGEALIRARRQREHDARRAKVLAEEEQAAARVGALRIEEAQLTEMIARREQDLAARVRRLHEYTLRRCGTYLHHLVRRHPDGAALIPFLNLALPALPDFFHHRDPGTGTPMGVAGHQAAQPPR
jgi:hypothetical protein